MKDDDYYTSVVVRNNRLLFRGVENGNRVQLATNFTPSYFLETNNPDEWKGWTGIKGEHLGEIEFDSISSSREFLREYEEAGSFRIHGNIGPEYQYIARRYPNLDAVSSSKFNIFFVDIETTAENGFPDPDICEEEILLITIKSNQSDRSITFGTLDYTEPDRLGNVVYYRLANETELLRAFIAAWKTDYPDAVSGWNTEAFDFTYLGNRITKILGEINLNKLSPWGVVYYRDRTVMGRTERVYTMLGIAQLDYLVLYKKFSETKRESYKLDFIGEVEIGQKKLENPESTFRDFYKKHPQMFVDYNIRDVLLVERLDQKLKLLDMVVTLAHTSGVNLEDVFFQTVMWDAIIYNYLLKRKIAIPPRPKSQRGNTFEGAYVMEPVPGAYKWLVSTDFNSLYPHLIMQYNMSPDTVQDDMMGGCSVDKFLDAPEGFTSALKAKDLTITPNGAMFSRAKRGFLPEILDEKYQTRKAVKTKMLGVKRDLEKMIAFQEAGDRSLVGKIQEAEDTITSMDTLQKVLKVSLNSAYGALGTDCYRYYDIRIAEGITLAGQLSIKWVIRDLDAWLNKKLHTEGVSYAIYADTDSVYLNLETLVSKAYPGHSVDETVTFLDKVCEAALEPAIDASMQHLADKTNAYAQKMVMKREVIADSGVWVGKKRYALRVYDSEHVRYTEPHLKVMGMEVVRTSTPKLVREKLKEAVGKILDRSETDLRSYVGTFRTEFDGLEPGVIAFPSTANGLSKYAGSPIYKSGTPIQTRAALLYNHHIKTRGLERKYPLLRNGDKFRFIYLNPRNPSRENVVGFVDELPPEFGLDGYVDREVQFNKVFLTPLENITKHLSWSVLEPGADLSAFFA